MKEMKHINKGIEKALISLNSELHFSNRLTGQKYTLICIPESLDEEIHISQNGNVLPPDFTITPEEIFAEAMEKRGTR